MRSGQGAGGHDAAEKGMTPGQGAAACQHELPVGATP